jgi:DNA-binding NtrC family response regulator
MVSTLADILELHGWETFRGYDGLEAVRLVGEREIDVVLTDVRMPRLDGLGALTEIKAQRPSARVILMTAFVGPDLLRRAEEEGSLSILRKPVDAGELAKIVHDGASRSRPVLIVDSDGPQLTALGLQLTTLGITTLSATTIDDALQLFRRERSGAVLLGFRMDHLDSSVSIIVVREINPSVLLILYSGGSADLTRTVAAASGGMVHAAFTKPVQIEKLLAVLEAADPP